MGHERHGLLPKSRRWRDLVRLIASAATTASVADIAEQTLRNVQSRFRRLEKDEAVQAAFGFFLALSVASRSANPARDLAHLGINLPPNATPLAVVRALRQWVGEGPGSREYDAIVQGAAADTIGAWYERNTDQQPLFRPDVQSYTIWRRAGNGSGFCELARLFFSHLTERYLSYFLDREASAALADVGERALFRDNLSHHIDLVSRHAFETSKIAESFAAGWFNRNARQGIPGKQAVESFLSVAFRKIGEELRRESASR